MEPMKQQDIEKMQEEAKQKLETMSGDDSQKKEALSEISEQLNNLYESGKSWMKTNMDADVIQPKLQKLKEDSEELLAKAKTKVQTIAENPEVRDKFNEGKDIVVDAGTKVIQAVSEGAQEFLNQDQIKKVVDSVSNTVVNTIDSIANDERIKEGVSSLKKGTLKVAESAFNGLKKILEETTDDEK